MKLFWSWYRRNGIQVYVLLWPPGRVHWNNKDQSSSSLTILSLFISRRFPQHKNHTHVIDVPLKSWGYHGLRSHITIIINNILRDIHSPRIETGWKKDLAAPQQHTTRCHLSFVVYCWRLYSPRAIGLHLVSKCQVVMKVLCQVMLHVPRIVLIKTSVCKALLCQYYWLHLGSCFVLSATPRMHELHSCLSGCSNLWHLFSSSGPWPTLSLYMPSYFDLATGSALLGWEVVQLTNKFSQNAWKCWAFSDFRCWRMKIITSVWALACSGRL